MEVRCIYIYVAGGQGYVSLWCGICRGQYCCSFYKKDDSFFGLSIMVCWIREKILLRYGK